MPVSRWALRLIVCHPRVQERLQQELDQVRRMIIILMTIAVKYLQG